MGELRSFKMGEDIKSHKEKEFIYFKNSYKNISMLFSMKTLIKYFLQIYFEILFVIALSLVTIFILSPIENFGGVGYGLFWCSAIVLFLSITSYGLINIAIYRIKLKSTKK